MYKFKSDKKKFQTETLLEEKRLYSFIFYLDKIKLQLENIKLILLGKIIVRKGKEYLFWLSCLNLDDRRFLVK